MRLRAALRALLATTLAATGLVVLGSATPASAAFGDTFLQEWGTGTSVNGIDVRSTIVHVATGSQIRKYSEIGDLQLTVNLPGTAKDVAVDSSGAMYVLIVNEVFKYDVNGAFVSRWGTTGTADGEFDAPQGIAVGPADGVFVADTGNDRVQKFTSAGAHLATLTSFGAGGADSFDTPQGIDVDTLGNVYVADLGNSRVLRFNSTAVLTLTIPIASGSIIDVAVQGAGTGATILALDFNPSVGSVRYYDASGTSLGGLPRDTGTGLGEWISVSSIGAATDSFYLGAEESFPSTEMKVMRFGEAEPELSVLKQADQASVIAGDDIDYTITVTNTGNQTVTGLTISDPNAPDCAGAAVPSTLAPGQDFVRTCFYTTVGGDIPSRSNTATADSAQTSPTNSNTVNTTVLVPPTGIGGTVTENGTGSPVGGAFVAVLDSSNFSMAAGDVADGSGNYLAEVDPGTYYVYVIDTSGDHAAGFFGAPTLVTVNPGATSDADPELEPTRGTISGTLIEDGTGNPVNQGWAVTIDATTGRPGPADETNFLGQYEITDLPAGDHLLVFLNKDGIHQPEFYDDSAGPGTAAPATVIGGGTTTANASLAPMAAPGTGAFLQGTVTQDGSGDPIPGAWVVALNAATYGIVKAAIANVGGTYTIQAPPGDYKLEFIDPTGEHLMEWHDDLPFSEIGNADSVTLPPSVVVTVDADLLPVAGSFGGTVTDQTTGNPISGAWVIAIGPSGIDGGAVTAPNGGYHVTDLPPADHRATFVNPNGGHAQEYWDDSPDYNGSTPFGILSGAVTKDIDAALGASP